MTYNVFGGTLNLALSIYLPFLIPNLNSFDHNNSLSSVFSSFPSMQTRSSIMQSHSFSLNLITETM